MKKITEKDKYLSNILVDFLKSHPAISVNMIEQLANIPQSTINKAFSGERTIPSQHIYPLFCILAEYGLEYEGFSLRYDPDDNTILAYKLSDNVRTIEIREYADGTTKEFYVTENFEDSEDENEGDIDEMIEDEAEEIESSTSFVYLQEVQKIIFTDYFDL